MNKFSKYTDEELRMWIWSQDNLTPATKYLRNEEEYKQAIAEKERRIKQILTESKEK